MTPAFGAGDHIDDLGVQVLEGDGLAQRVAHVADEPESRHPVEPGLVRMLQPREVAGSGGRLASVLGSV